MWALPSCLWRRSLGLVTPSLPRARAFSFLGYFFFEVPGNIILHRVGGQGMDRPHHDRMGPDVLP